MATEYNTSSRESEDKWSPGLSGRRQNNANLSYRKSRLLRSMDGPVCVIFWSRFANGLLDDVTMKLTFYTAIVPVLRCQVAWVTAPCFDHYDKIEKYVWRVFGIPRLFVGDTYNPRIVFL